jgi:hypothetical protein
MGAIATVFPSIYELYLTVTHDDASIVGPGCDDQFEFEFALDLLLSGLEQLREREVARSPGRPASRLRNGSAATKAHPDR